MRDPETHAQLALPPWHLRTAGVQRGLKLAQVDPQVVGVEKLVPEGQGGRQRVSVQGRQDKSPRLACGRAVLFLGLIRVNYVAQLNNKP